MGAKSFTRAQLLSLSRTMIGLFSRNLNLSLDNSHVKKLFSSLVSVDINAGLDGYYDVFASFAFDLCNTSGLLSGNIDSVLRSCMEVFFLSVSQAFSWNFDINLALDTAVGLVVGVGLGVGTDIGLGLGANVGTDVGVGLGANVGADIGVDAGFGLGADLDAGVSAGLDTSVGLGVDVDADVDVDAIVKFKTGLVLRLKAFGIFKRMGSVSVTRPQLIYMSKTIVGLLGKILGLQLGRSHVKTLLSLLVSVDISTGFDGYYGAFSTFVSQILASGGLLKGDLDAIYRQCLEVFFLGVSKTFNFKIDIGTALGLALGVNVGADVGADLAAGVGAAVDTGVDVGVGLEAGVDVGAAVDTDVDVGVGLDAGVDLGAALDASVDVGVGLDAGATTGMGVNADVGANAKVGVDVDVAAQFGLGLLSRLRASHILDRVDTRSFSKGQLLALSKSIVRLFAKRFRVPLGNSVVKSLFKLLLAVDINRGSEGYYGVFAVFASRVLSIKGLLNGNLDDVYRSCLEVIFLSLSQTFNFEVDISTTLDLALRVGANVKADADVGVDAGVGVGADVGVAVGASSDAGVAVGVGAEVGVGVDAAVGVQMDAEADVGVSADAGVAVEADVDVDVRVATDVASKLGLALVSSEEFNLALLSGDKESVLGVINSAITAAYGEAAGNAFASACGI